MYTCDFCGEDCLSPENLIPVVLKDGTGSNFYGECDYLICNVCLDDHADEVDVVVGSD